MVAYQLLFIICSRHVQVIVGRKQRKAFVSMQTQSNNYQEVWGI